MSPENRWLEVGRCISYCSSPFLDFLGDMLLVVFRGVQNDIFGCLLNILSSQNRIINVFCRVVHVVI